MIILEPLSAGSLIMSLLFLRDQSASLSSLGRSEARAFSGSQREGKVNGSFSGGLVLKKGRREGVDGFHEVQDGGR